MNTIGFLTADDAETAFYQAFENCDLQQMMQVWAPEESIICIHPMGVINQGLVSVRESWHQIFKSGEKMHFSISSEQRTNSETVAAHIVTETIYIHGDNKPRPPILATNLYHKTKQGWRMVLHHASPSVINVQPRAEQTPDSKHLH